MKKKIEENKATNPITTQEPINLIELEVAGLKIGPILKEARIKMGKKTEDIAEELKIRRIYLEAIENSDYKNIPEYPYGVGFVNSYATYLGLDGVKIANKFKSEINPEITRSYSTVVQEEISETASPSKKYLLVAILALIAVYGLWSVLASDSSQESVVVEPVVEEKTDALPIVLEEFENSMTQEETQVVVPEAVDELAQNEIVVAPTQAPQALAPRIKVVEETWVEVKTPTKLYISKVLKAGEEYVLPDDNDLSLSVGREKGIEFYVGEEKIEVIKPNKKTNIPLNQFINKETN